MKRGSWLRRRKTKSYYVAGIIPIQIGKVSVKQISINISVLGKEEIMTTVRVKMGFLEGNNTVNKTQSCN